MMWMVSLVVASGALGALVLLVTFLVTRSDIRGAEARIAERMAHVHLVSMDYVRRSASEARRLMRESASETREMIRAEAAEGRRQRLIIHRRTQRLLDTMDRRHRDTDTLIRMLLERSDGDRPQGQAT